MIKGTTPSAKTKATPRAQRWKTTPIAKETLPPNAKKKNYSHDGGHFPPELTGQTPRARAHEQTK